MTKDQFIAMIGEAETGGLRDAHARETAVGDGGLAGGFYQQHWNWRKDFWPACYWAVLRAMDARALELFLTAHKDKTAAELAELYNMGHAAPDPAYDARCIAGLQRLGIDPLHFHDRVSG